MTKELSDEIHRRVAELCGQGDALAGDRRYEAAAKRYAEAWALLPHPKEEWEAATWILAAMGDAAFLKRDFVQALEHFSLGIRSGGLGNPFFHLRAGECAFELGQWTRADDELTRAYMGAGKEIFEKEDPKYFRRLEGRLHPPSGADAL